MDNLLVMLDGVGDNFWILLSICLFIFAIIMTIVALILLRNVNKEQKRLIVKKDDFLKAFINSDELILMMLETDTKLPIYVVGDIKNVFKIELKDIQNDLYILTRFAKDPSEFKRIIDEYIKWDGSSELVNTFMGTNNKFYKLTISRNEKNNWDIFIMSDISNEMSKINDLKNKLSEAFEEGEIKSSFLSRMSHEIRTPLSGIIGLLDLTEKKIDNTSPIYNYIKDGQSLSEHMLSLINDILDMSRLDAGKTEIDHSPFSIKNFAEHLRIMFEPNITKKGLKFFIDYEDLDVDWVIGDELHLNQVIINFLSNSMKFTEKGEIGVVFKQMLKSDSQIDLMIRVHDTGKGMETSFINKIFRPFEQESIEIGKKYGGTGLGMAITDRLVKLMGGSIVINSTVGVGSDFSVYLTLPIADVLSTDSYGQEENIDCNEALMGKHILLVDDNDFNISISKEILEGMGALVDTASDGKVACKVFESSQTHFYDLILMDIQMPVMDGRSACREIRKLDRLDAKDVLIFALSADAFVEDVRKSLDAGMNAHLSKPIDYNEIKRQFAILSRNKKEC